MVESVLDHHMALVVHRDEAWCIVVECAASWWSVAHRGGAWCIVVHCGGVWCVVVERLLRWPHCAQTAKPLYHNPLMHFTAGQPLAGWGR